MTEQVLVDEHLSSLQSLENINNNDDMSNAISPIVDSDSRIELLERNLHYIKQQHEITLIDLNNEINRLQQENKDLHHQLNNTQLLSSIEQNQITDKSISENNFHLEQKINQLEMQLLKSEQRNKNLIHQIDELNQISSSKVEVSNTDDNTIPTQIIDDNYQHLLTMSYEKQQEITKLRSVLLEILNSERLSIASKILLRDCLSSTNISELSMNKTTTTPVDILYSNEKQQQRFNTSPATTGKTFSYRHELPIRRLNLSPPQAIIPRSISQHRSVEQRGNLPSIKQGNNSPLFQNPIDVVDSLYHPVSPTNYFDHQCLIKIGETPIARRERRTQVLQKNRLMKNLFH